MKGYRYFQRKKKRYVSSHFSLDGQNLHGTKRSPQNVYCIGLLSGRNQLLCMEHLHTILLQASLEDECIRLLWSWCLFCKGARENGGEKKKGGGGGGRGALACAIAVLEILTVCASIFPDGLFCGDLHIQLLSLLEYTCLDTPRYSSAINGRFWSTLDKFLLLAFSVLCWLLCLVLISKSRKAIVQEEWRSLFAKSSWEEASCRTRKGIQRTQ